MIRVVFRLGFISMVFMAPLSYATYDVKCMQALLSEGKQHEALAWWRSTWDPAFAIVSKLDRKLSDIEYEAVMDVHRDLPLIAVFENGTKGVFQNEKESLKKLWRQLSRTRIVAVTYLPESLVKLGSVLKSACVALNRSGCEVYDNYQGLSSANLRPFTPAQEQAIKWSTFHMLPPKEMVKLYRIWTDLQARTENLEATNERKNSAEKIIKSAFTQEQASILLDRIVHPYIAAAFEHLIRMTKGVKSN